MNERIRELAVEAGYKDLPTVRLAFQGFDKEKFAELIVVECADIADEYDGVGSTIVGRMRKHFGVEE
jgi:hypothetical protein